MSLGAWFARLPSGVARALLPLLRYLNLMRALEMRCLAPWTQKVEGWRVLDVGCGHGIYSLDLARRGAGLVGCDLQRPSLAAATQMAQGLDLNGRSLFVAADGSRLPTADSSFDLVVCNCVLEHIVDDQGALTSMVRALRPGGLLYLAVDSAEHGLVLGFLDRLPPGLKSLVLRPEIASAPSVSEGLAARLDELYSVLRRYHRDELASALSALGMTVLDSRPYLTGVGAAQYEAVHIFKGLSASQGLGRWFYMASSLLVYPFAALSDKRRHAPGYGLALVARKERPADR